MFDHTRRRNTRKQWIQDRQRVMETERKVRKMATNKHKKSHLTVWEQEARGSSPRTPTNWVENCLFLAVFRPFMFSIFDVSDPLKFFGLWTKNGPAASSAHRWNRLYPLSDPLLDRTVHKGLLHSEAARKILTTS